MLYLVALLIPPLAIALCRKWAQAVISLVLTGGLWAMIAVSCMFVGSFLEAVNQDNNLNPGLRGVYTQVWFENSTAYAIAFALTLALLIIVLTHAIMVVHNHYSDVRMARLIGAVHVPPGSASVA